MELLKEELITKAGLTDEQAVKAITIFSAFLKHRVPPVIHTQLDRILEGNSLEDSIKTQLGDLGNDIKDKAEGLAKDLQRSFEKAFGAKKE